MHVWVKNYTGWSQLSTNCIKCKVLCLGKHNLGVQHRLKSTLLRSSSVERGLGDLLDKISMSYIEMLGWLNRVSETEIKKSLSYYIQHFPGHNRSSVHFWFLQHIIDVDSLERSREFLKDDQRTRKPNVWKCLRDLGNSGESMLSQDLITMLQHLRDGYKEDGHSLFTGRNHMETMRGSG